MLSGSSETQRQREAITVCGFTPTFGGSGGVFQRAVPPFPTPLRPDVAAVSPFSYDVATSIVELPSLTAEQNPNGGGGGTSVGSQQSSAGGGGFLSKIFSSSSGPSTISRHIVRTSRADRLADVLFWLGTDGARPPPPRPQVSVASTSSSTTTSKKSGGVGFFSSAFGSAPSGSKDARNETLAHTARSGNAASGAMSGGTGDAQFDAFLRRVELSVPEAERRELLRRTGGGATGTAGAPGGGGSLTGRAGRAYAATGDVAAVHGVVSEMQQRLAERGERLQRAQQRSQEMADAAAEFQRLSAELRQKAKWF
jgi:hypothetical protein